MRLLHTADWQIGMRAAHVGTAATAVRDARFEAARRVVQLAGQHRVDAILVAGDTFEDNAVDRVLVQKVADILAGFDGPVLIIPGNHDPLAPGSVWQHAAWQRPNVQVIAQAAPVELADGVIYPCPIFDKHSRKDPTAWIVAQGERVAVGLAHGSVEGLSDELDYPIARDAALRSRLDYLALGHWHSTATYTSDGATRMAYSGTHETTRFGERDSGNVLLVEIAHRGAAPKLTSLSTGLLGWQSLEVSIRDPGDLQRLRDQIEAMTDGAKTLLSLSVDGVLWPEERGEIVRIEELLSARLLYARSDFSRLRPEPSGDAWVTGLPPGPLQDAARRLQQWAATSSGEPAPEVAARALVELYALMEEARP